MLLVSVSIVLSLLQLTVTSADDKKLPSVSKNVSIGTDKPQTDRSPLKNPHNHGLWFFERHSKQPLMWHSKTDSIVHPKMHFQVPAPGIIGSTPASNQQRCPLSPFAQFLTDGEQEALHELIVEARQNGASEPQIKEHINRYLKEILTAEKLEQFEEANANFEKERFSNQLGSYNKWPAQTEKELESKEDSERQKPDTNEYKRLSRLLLKTH